ncbi:MAG: hypothetical protein HQL14_06555 [Candidatus Omnitrophica bacterium]|nr:hypothetical protein [Candidatus Omnitrophota bacterium]
MKNIIVCLTICWLVFGFNRVGVTSQYNFNYSDGFRPWEMHVKTQINTTFEALMSKNDYLRSLKCTDDQDAAKYPLSIKGVCLQGQGAKMIVPQDQSVFYSPLQGGLTEQEHMTHEVPYQFFDKVLRKERFGSIYFVVPFNGYEVPTYYPIETLKNLPLWKQAFQKTNDMTDDYFSKHIFVVGTYFVDTSYWPPESRGAKHLNIVYYYSLDWARVMLEDSFNEGLPLTAKIKPMEHVSSQEQVIDSIKRASARLGFDVDGIDTLSVGRDGQLVMKASGVVDDKANKCLYASILLENAQVSVQEGACRVY